MYFSNYSVTKGHYLIEKFLLKIRGGGQLKTSKGKLLLVCENVITKRERRCVYDGWIRLMITKSQMAMKIKYSFELR